MQGELTTATAQTRAELATERERNQALERDNRELRDELRDLDPARFEASRLTVGQDGQQV